ncbi:MAG: hypothetical protein H0U13_15510, partial [Gemmatimonadaceae bacterium]|nr:hypothetical protein [Gemmatimonadaceae bacterium]
MMRESPFECLARRVVMAVLAAAACSVAAAPGSLGAQFQALETPTMRLIYTSPSESYLVPQVVASFDKALRFHQKLFDYVPPDRTNVLMHDLWHYG